MGRKVEKIHRNVNLASIASTKNLSFTIAKQLPSQSIDIASTIIKSAQDPTFFFNSKTKSPIRAHFKTPVSNFISDTVKYLNSGKIQLNII